MAYRIVKYIICARILGDEHHCRLPQYKFSGDVSPCPPVIYAHILTHLKAINATKSNGSE